jgi:hypothetical protein
MDPSTLAAVEYYGVDRMLRESRHDLCTGRYRPAPMITLILLLHSGVQGSRAVRDG